MNSELLKKDVRYSIYLPEGYEQSNRSYPVLYLLHGYTDDETGWTQFGEVQHIADKAIDSGEATSMIIVMPNAEVTWYCNDYRMEYPYEDMFIKELIPFIEKNYRVHRKKQFRAVAGLSMGGWGALKFSMKYSEQFSACVAFSAAIYTDNQLMNYTQEKYDYRFGFLFGKGLTGKKRLTEEWKNQQVIYLAENLSVNKLKSVRYYIDCGDDDILCLGNAELHAKLNEKRIPHEFRVRDGRHSWEYWRSGLPEGLKFITKSFHR
ncbi:esterase family protein [Puteibacter caeruleilacunae]|nr:esterase family protein [Puteibacter caeruleilacunae]